MKELIQSALTLFKASFTIYGITVTWWQLFLFVAVVTLLIDLVMGMFE